MNIITSRSSLSWHDVCFKETTHSIGWIFSSDLHVSHEMFTSGALNDYMIIILDVLVSSHLKNRWFKRLLQPLLQELQRPRETLLFQELPYIQFLRFKAMHRCFSVELCHSIFYFHQTSLIYGGWWECGLFGCSVSHPPTLSQRLPSNTYGIASATLLLIPFNIHLDVR